MSRDTSHNDMTAKMHQNFCNKIRWKINFLDFNQSHKINELRADITFYILSYLYQYFSNECSLNYERKLIRNL